MKVGRPTSPKSPRVPRVVPANVQSGRGFDSSDDEVVRLETILEASVGGSGNKPRIGKPKAVGANALAGVIRQAQLRIVAKTIRAWYLKPFTRPRVHESEKDRFIGAASLVNSVSRSPTVRGRSEFFLRLKFLIEKTESDMEWESVSEHIQKLRDLLGFQLLTSVVDKVQVRDLFSSLIALKTGAPEFVS